MAFYFKNRNKKIYGREGLRKRLVTFSWCFFDSHLDSFDLNAPRCGGLIQVGLYFFIKATWHDRKREKHTINYSLVYTWTYISTLSTLIPQAVVASSSTVCRRIVKSFHTSSLWKGHYAQRKCLEDKNLNVLIHVLSSHFSAEKQSDFWGQLIK